MESTEVPPQVQQQLGRIFNIELNGWEIEKVNKKHIFFLKEIFPPDRFWIACSLKYRSYHSMFPEKKYEKLLALSAKHVTSTEQTRGCARRRIKTHPQRTYLSIKYVWTSNFLGNIPIKIPWACSRRTAWQAILLLGVPFELCCCGTGWDNWSQSARTLGHCEGTWREARLWGGIQRAVCAHPVINRTEPELHFELELLIFLKKKINTHTKR